MAFNPDAYLAKKSGGGGFDPDAYLAKKMGGQQGGEQPSGSGILRKGWDALKVPEQMSREGLNMIADSLPESYTGDIVRDTVVNTPRIAAETLAEVAPGFVSRGAILSAGAAKALPLAAKTAAWGSEQLEKASGLSYRTPKVLAETFKKPSLFYKGGIEKAREMYQKAKGAPIRDELSDLSDKKDFVAKAVELSKKGDITPEEALEARKTLGQLKKNVTEVWFRKMHKILDDTAKTKFGQADEAYQNAVKAENMRQIFAVNKSGSPSIVKGSLTTVFPPLAPLMSPAVQGFTASTLGAALNPAIRAPIRVGAAGVAAAKGLSRFLNRGEQ